MPQRTSATNRAVAIFEAAKGALVLIAGFGLAAAVHQDMQPLADELARHSHLNPAQNYPHIFIQAATRLHDAHLWLLAGGAGCYALLRFVEAFGLWKGRSWAEWIAATGGGIYLPFEIYHLSQRFDVLSVVIFAVNVLIVVVMVRALLQRRPRKEP